MDSTLYSILDHLSEKYIKSEKINLWPSVREQLDKQTSQVDHQAFFLKKNFLLPAFVLGLILIGFGVFLFDNVKPVSAQQILERAVAVQAATDPSLGIHHTQKESTVYLYPTEGKSSPINYIIDSYYDVKNGRIRWVSTNPETGKIIDAFAFDGTYTFSADQSWLANPSGNLLPIIRTLENEDSLIMVIRGGANTTAQQWYEIQRNSGDFELVGKSNWQDGDGRKVYVLRSKMSKDESAGSFSYILIFDAQTCQLLEQQEIINKDGHEYLSSATKYLTDEILPFDSQVAWDLSDLQGVKFIDGPGVTH
jgi:hypothetical protein